MRCAQTATGKMVNNVKSPRTVSPSNNTLTDVTKKHCGDHIADAVGRMAIFSLSRSALHCLMRDLQHVHVTW